MSNILKNIQAGSNAIKEATAKMEEAERVANSLSDQAKLVSNAVSHPESVGSRDVLIKHVNEGNLPNDMVSKLAGTSNANGNEINQVHNIVRTDDIPNEATKVNESKGGIGLNDVLTGIDNVDMFSKVNTVVFSITDDVGMLYYLKKMFFSFVNSSSLMLTMQRDRS